MAFPVTARTTGTLITATIWNSDLKDNLNALYGGSMAISGQAAFDDVYAASTTALGVGRRQLRQTFRGLTLRTHPDADVAAYKVRLDHADEIVMHDGTSVLDWDDLTADITASGANGLDTGSEGASRWYSIHAIRKSSDGTKGLLLHRAKNYASDQTQTTDNSAQKLRDAANHTRLAQSFVAGLSGALPFVDAKWIKTGTPTGQVWFTIEADSAGAPSGTPLATSDKLDATLIATSDQWVRSIFRTPPTLTATTTYWLVAYGNFTIDAANYLSWQESSSGSYASGAAFVYNGTTWSADGAGFDFCFTTYVTQNDTALTMPSGYDQYALIGWVYNDSGSNFVVFSANGRAVSFPSTQVVGSFTTTYFILTDLSALIPPVAVDAGFLIGHSGAGCNVNFSSQWGASFFQLASTASSFATIPIPPLLVEFQSAYFSTNTSTGYVRIAGFKW